jgi:hypothetical protein
VLMTFINISGEVRYRVPRYAGSVSGRFGAETVSTALCLRIQGFRPAEHSLRRQTERSCCMGLFYRIFGIDRRYLNCGDKYFQLTGGYVQFATGRGNFYVVIRMSKMYHAEGKSQQKATESGLTTTYKWVYKDLTVSAIPRGNLQNRAWSGVAGEIKKSAFLCEKHYKVLIYQQYNLVYARY